MAISRPLGPFRRPKVPLIMQWNCAGIQQRLCELSLFLRDIPIPILALSEAGLPNGRTIPGYIRHGNPSIPSFANGSAMIYIRREIPHVALPVQDLCSTYLEVTAVQVCLGNRKLSVVSVYISPRRKVSMEAFIKDLCIRCPSPRIICGDFNAHHSLWGDKIADFRGKELVAAADAADLCIANDGKPTFFRPPGSWSATYLRRSCC